MYPYFKIKNWFPLHLHEKDSLGKHVGLLTVHSIVF